MEGNELRKSFLEFFKSKGHEILPSDSLIPSHDKSLLFTGAGMNQFKDMFIGSKRLPYTKIATSQKCLRTGDLETVGTTNRHHSFFEMLGNFSFGDYFKKEAIQWAWEYLTSVLQIPQEKLYVSIYKDDEESYKIWTEQIKVPDKKIYRFGEDDNFWPSNAPSEGPDGPCGPCSEIYYDYGKEHSCDKPSCDVGCSCNRYVEVWNLVFTQYDRQGINTPPLLNDAISKNKRRGKLVPLKQKNIDTGMGLERLAAVMQGKISNFETDLFEPIIKECRELIIVESQNEPETASLRKIADHVRAITFCIGDGIIPSNEERGYVVRRILRQAQRHIHKYGINIPLLYKLVHKVSEVMGKHYPIIKEKLEPITHIIKSEEEKFLNVLDKGNIQLLEMIKKSKGKGSNQLQSDDIFFLYDTYGFPPELTREIARENGVGIDLKGFYRELETQKERSRQKSGFSTEIFEKGALLEITSKTRKTTFKGYKETQTESEIEAIIRNNELVTTASAGDNIIIILKQTPFYAEGGGQVGDTGFLFNNRCRVRVNDTQSFEQRYLHDCKIVEGTVSVGERITAEIERDRRLNIMRNHTGTHLLQAALRKVLGNNIEQTGSVVEEDKLRFDFTRPRPLTEEEIRRVEDEVNKEILKDEIVEKIEMSMEEAKNCGALMFFGEKYPEKVRVVKTEDDFSKELCGGTHLDRTSIIGMFKITAETSVGSGVRRIEAVTGKKAKELFMKQYDILNNLEHTLRSSLDDIPLKIERLIQENNQLKSQLKKTLSGANVADTMIKASREKNGVKYCFYELDGEYDPSYIRNMTDTLIKKNSLDMTLVVSEHNSKKFGILGIGKALTDKGITSKEVISKFSEESGVKGGGKPHMAQVGFIKGYSKQKVKKDLEEIISSI